VKIGVLASPDDAHHLLPTLRVLKDLGVPAYALSISLDWIKLERSKVRAYMEEGSHFILVADSRSVDSSWFGYAVGYASSKRNGISLLRVDPAWNPPRYLKGFPIFEDLAELRTFFAVQKEEWTLEEARQSARTSLLELGISYHTESLASCIADGDIHGVRLFLDAGFNPNARDKHGVPLLCLAARSKHRGVAETLLDRGAQIDLQAEDRGYSALMDATLAGDPDLVSFLLDRGANPDLLSKDGQSALVIAVGRKDVPTVRKLVDRGADPDLADKLGLSAHGYAKLFKHAELLALFGAGKREKG
jgi:hypothetical protein